MSYITAIDALSRISSIDDIFFVKSFLIGYINFM